MGVTIRFTLCYQVFTVIFTVEAVIKLTAFSKEYFSVRWNIFDLVIVILSLPDLVLFSLNEESTAGFAEVARIVKIFRLVGVGIRFRFALLLREKAALLFIADISHHLQRFITLLIG